MTRRFLCCTLAALCLYSIFPCRILAVETSAASAILMDADSGRVLYERNADRKMLIASTTKLMTALVALELGEPSQVITVTAAHMAEGSSMYLRPGEKLTLEELLYGLLLCSGNDAALALTECAGGVAPFVERMNEKAAALGMRNSHFANPNGLDDEAHYSTAYDMALLGCAAVNEPTLRRMVSTRTAVIGGRVRGAEDRVHEGGGADAGVLRGAGGTSAGGGDTAGRGRLERPRGTVPLGVPADRHTGDAGDAPARRTGKRERGIAMTERIQKLLAAAGLCSRRTAEEWIAAGRVTVNGRRVHVGDKADPETDDIRVDGRPLRGAAQHVYLMLHKPRGYVTTLSDERGRPTAASLVRGCGARVYPVGRLDLDSEGLLLFTNDGALTHALLHPSHQVDKTYIVTVTGAAEDSARQLSAVDRLDGQPIVPAAVTELYQKDGTAKYRVVIHQGKKRQIRRMCAAAGLTVTRLCRVAEGSIALGDLPPGKWRYLTAEELQSIKGSHQHE